MVLIYESIIVEFLLYFIIKEERKIIDLIEDLLNCMHIRWNDEDKG